MSATAPVPKIRLRAFRSTDDPETCIKFIEGHARVLELIGIKKVTSSNHDWMYNPSSFTIVVESLDRSKVYGGARIQAADRKTPLPIEDATGYMDPKIYSIVDNLTTEGTSELCGLWNSREVAGMGVGAFFATKAGVVISEQIGIKSIFALCAPTTVRFANKVGCVIYDEVGNEGTFYYPKLDLLATVVLLKNTETLEDADEYERNSIFELRQNLHTVMLEKIPGRNFEVEIEYDLKLHNVSSNEFKLPKP